MSETSSGGAEREVAGKPIVPFTDQRCACMPWQQSWRAETPGWCATCGLPFKTYLRAREVCLKTEGCLLLPDHEGPCQ